MSSALLIACDEDAALQERLAMRGVPMVALPEQQTWSPIALLAACRSVAADPTVSWLACRDAGAIRSAASAGLAGVVLIGLDPPPGEHGCVVARAETLADCPRVMVPHGGGCWHGAGPTE